MTQGEIPYRAEMILDSVQAKIPRKATVTPLRAQSEIPHKAEMISLTAQEEIPCRMTMILLGLKKRYIVGKKYHPSWLKQKCLIGCNILKV